MSLENFYDRDPTNVLRVSRTTCRSGPTSRSSVIERRRDPDRPTTANIYTHDTDEAAIDAARILGDALEGAR